MIAIRRATPSDQRELNVIIQSSRAYDGPYRAILDGYELTRAQILEDHVYVAEVDGHVSGFYSLVADDAGAELDLLFVADAAQGRGVGSALLRHLKSQAASLGIKSVKIISHPPALQFYLNAGAEEEGIVSPHGRITWDRPLLRLRVGAP